MYAGSREIGQPGSYLAQASFRKFVCVRGSVSSVLRCVRRRNEYKNNVSMGMMRRSFYLLNLFDESLEMGREKNGERSERGERREEAERKEERYREKRGGVTSTSPTMEIRFIVFGLLPAFAVRGP